MHVSFLAGLSYKNTVYLSDNQYFIKKMPYPVKDMASVRKRWWWAYFVAPAPSTQATTAPVIEAITVAAKMSTATALSVLILVVPYMVKSIAPATKNPTHAPDLAPVAAVLTCPTQEKI